MQTITSQDQLNRIESELQQVKQLLKFLIEKVAQKDAKELDETPNEYLRKSLRQSEEDVKAGRVSPPFTNVKDAITWLDDPDASYENGDKVRDEV